MIRRTITPLISLAAAALALVYSADAGAEVARQQTGPPQQHASGVKPSDSKFRVVRSVSGTKGRDQDGKYVIEDPRTLFYIPDDKQVIVYFEWDGPPGSHSFEALWKNPEGRVMMISTFSFRAEQERFAGYFTMLLGSSASTGAWAVEARIDGDTAGTHAFQILDAPRPADAIPARRILSRAEIYQRGAASSVFIENLNRNGERQNLGSGFFIDQGLILTAFQVIEGATLIRIITPDGRRVEAKEALAWNRRQDWAFLRIEAGKVSALERVASSSFAIGDRCYSLDVPGEGSRVIVEGNLIGKHNSTGAGERLNLSFHVGRRAIGSPLLNEYGEVLGLIGGILIPGSALLEEMGIANPTNLLQSGNADRRALAVPMSSINEPLPNTTPTSFEELARSGQFTPPLIITYRNVASAVLARDVERKWDILQPVDEKYEYSRRDSQAMLLLTWYPKQKRKGVPSVRIFDLDNRLLTESKTKAISLNPNKLTYSTWQMGLTSLPVGIYRIDVFLDADPVWRLYFRKVE